MYMLVMVVTAPVATLIFVSPPIPWLAVTMLPSLSTASPLDPVSEIDGKAIVTLSFASIFRIRDGGGFWRRSEFRNVEGVCDPDGALDVFEVVPVAVERVRRWDAVDSHRRAAARESWSGSSRPWGRRTA